jgi:hypothetical protein
VSASGPVTFVGNIFFQFARFVRNSALPRTAWTNGRAACPVSETFVSIQSVRAIDSRLPNLEVTMDTYDYESADDSADDTE